MAVSILALLDLSIPEASDVMPFAAFMTSFTTIGRNLNLSIVNSGPYLKVSKASEHHNPQILRTEYASNPQNSAASNPRNTIILQSSEYHI